MTSDDLPTPREAPLLVSDADRDGVSRVLSDHFVAGRLTFEELSDRLQAAMAARTTADLTAATLDLPGRDILPVQTPSATSMMVAVFGSYRRKGRWRIAPEATAIAAFGDVKIDLRNAVFDASGVQLRAAAIFGSVTVIVPEGVEVELDGPAIFGDNSMRGRSDRSLPGMPSVRIRAASVFGSVSVRIR